jgi:hypothetical protein
VGECAHCVCLSGCFRPHSVKCRHHLVIIASLPWLAKLLPKHTCQSQRVSELGWCMGSRVNLCARFVSLLQTK